MSKGKKLTARELADLFWIEAIGSNKPWKNHNAMEIKAWRAVARYVNRQEKK